MSGPVIDAIAPRNLAIVTRLLLFLCHSILVDSRCDLDWVGVMDPIGRALAEGRVFTHVRPMRTALTIGLLSMLAAVAAPAEQPAELIKVGAFTFTVPDGWKKVAPTSPMRKAQLEVSQGSEKAEVTFFQFGGDQGGNVADNVARWFAQFPGSEEKRKTETVQAGSVKITFATTEGTFSSGMPGGPTTPMNDYALVGAILENRDGNIFIKMTGPKPIVKSSTDAFKKMVSEAAKNSAPQV